MDSIVPCRNVHTGHQDPLLPIVPVSFSAPVLISCPCSGIKLSNWCSTPDRFLVLFFMKQEALVSEPVNMRNNGNSNISTRAIPRVNRIWWTVIIVRIFNPINLYSIIKLWSCSRLLAPKSTNIQRWQKSTSAKHWCFYQQGVDKWPFSFFALGGNHSIKPIALDYAHIYVPVKIQNVFPFSKRSVKFLRLFQTKLLSKCLCSECRRISKGSLGKMYCWWCPTW